MKTLLAIIGALVVIAVCVLFSIGWLANKGVITTPATPSGGASTTSSGDAAPSGVRLGEGKDPLGQGFTGCTHFSERMSRMFSKDEQGERTYTGHLSLWLRTDCPSEVDLSSSIDGFDLALVHVTGREARLWVDCNREMFWTEYVRYTKNGETLRERTSSKQHGALEEDGDGEIILPNSLLDQATLKSCREVSREGAVK